ncbi:hypothetical protein CMO96_03035 [Candidatus Woesebacteria bacterium]|nr:hypothetical protein [Candidatus Woesebacteria bacterium]
MKLSSILGLNARFQLYAFPHNTPRGKSTAASKVFTKKKLNKAGIRTPESYAAFRKPKNIIDFDWGKLPASFAFKPSGGLGGEGIIVVKKRARDGDGWITTQRRRVTIDDLKLHALDILEGAYNDSNIPDVAFFEEYVGRHKAFRKYAYRGTPDIRVVVFNNVPVMAMLRLPTLESKGRANIHQGAIGVGIDIATGITTHAVWHGETIKFKPETKRKLHGIRIPDWTEILKSSVHCQKVLKLGYAGVDVMLHPDKGPMVSEVNSAPGLEIQLANMAGLRKRLDRVEGLKVSSVEQGVQLAKTLFASDFAVRVRAEDEGVKVVDVFEEVKVKSKGGKKVAVRAKLDTGAWRSAIDKTLAKELGLLEKDNVLLTRLVRSAFGRQKRQVIDITFWLKGRRIRTTAGVVNRKRLKNSFIIGRRDLVDFFVVPQRRQRAN